MSFAPPSRRRHTERARLGKRLPQQSSGIGSGLTDAEDDFPPSPGLLSLTGPFTLTRTGVRTPTGSSVPVVAQNTALPPPPAVIPTSSPYNPPESAPTQKVSPSGKIEAGNSPVAAAASRSKGLSGGGIAGVVITVLVLVGGIIVFLMRKRFMSMRQKKRATWNGGAFSKTANISSPKPAPAGAPTPWAFPQTAQGIPAPPMSYNNPTAIAASINPTGPKPSPSSTTASVRCTFIPSLPDELSITTGEVVRVVQEYDDGWALCANTRGEQGMVPLECLEKSSMTPNYGADWRNAQRASSLISPGGSRY